MSVSFDKDYLVASNSPLIIFIILSKYSKISCWQEINNSLIILKQYNFKSLSMMLSDNKSIIKAESRQYIYFILILYYLSIKY